VRPPDSPAPADTPPAIIWFLPSGVRRARLDLNPLDQKKHIRPETLARLSLPERFILDE
jgi:hypothetical protein